MRLEVHTSALGEEAKKCETTARLGLADYQFSRPHVIGGCLLQLAQPCC